jgi:RNA polymerase sigma-70 factor, ECF subfamily
MSGAEAGTFSPPRTITLQMGIARGRGDGTSDVELVRRAIGGEREAFAEIYNRYHTVVYRFARMMSGSAALAEDVTQETFTVLLRDLDRYEPQRASISTYLYGLARNLTRSDGNEPRSSGDHSDALEQSQQLRRLRQAIADLPSRYREVVILCAIQGLSYAEVAAVLGTPVGTVRSRLSRGRQAIAARMRETEDAGVVPHRAARCIV